MLGALIAYVRAAAGDEAVERVRREAGEERVPEELQDPNGWSTYRQGLDLFKAAARVLDDPDVGRKAGIELVRQYAGSEVMALIRSLGSPAEMLRVYPAIQAKQSTVTQAEVIEVGDDRGSVSVVTVPPIKRDPIFCGYTAGALSQIPVLFGMEPAVILEPECQTRGSRRCVFEVSWDPTSSLQANVERELKFLRDQVETLTKRFESLESVAKELSTVRDVDSVLETITKQAGVAVRAPRYLLAVRLPGDVSPRIHHVGFAKGEAKVVAEDLLDRSNGPEDPSRLVVDIASARINFGRLAAYYPQEYHFLPQERSLLLAYAGHAAAALETAAALAESRDRNTTLSALLALGKALTQATSKQEVAECVVEATPDVVGCEHAFVLLWDPGDAILTRAGGTLPSVDGRNVPRNSLRYKGLPSRMLEGSEPLLVSPSSDPLLQEVLALTDLTYALLIPLTARYEFLGLFVVGSENRDLLSSEVVRERVAGVAGLASTALDGAKLLDAVRYQALHDPITDLPNARLFEDRVSHAITVARRAGARHGLLFIDLDRFKSVNDTHGHKVGDELLRAVAHRLSGVLRDTDTVARIGGDEFGILVQGIRADRDATKVAEKIVDNISKPFTVKGVTVSIGASVGITAFPEDLDTYESAISRADSAMYRAKADGRGTFVFFEIQKSS